MLIIGDPGSGKTNVLLNLIKCEIFVSKRFKWTKISVFD